MIKQLVRLLMATLVAFQATAAPAPKAARESVQPVEQEHIQYKIVTASEKGTYIVLGRDLATYVADDAGIELESLPSAGSSENVFRLRYEPGVKLALDLCDVV